MHRPQDVEQQTRSSLRQWDLCIGVNPAGRSHITKIDIDRHYFVGSELFSNVKQSMRLTGSAPTIDDLMVTGRQYRNQGPQVDERLDESLSVHGLGPPGDPDESCIDRVCYALFFGH
jgi:hypothetical protein